MVEKASTRTEQVYNQLRADVLSGRLAPGKKLPLSQLSDRYGSSLSAIREGLQRLVEQGLVTSEPQLGFRVFSLSVEDLHDLTSARVEIEGLALRLSIEHGDLEWESSVVAALHTLRRTPVEDEATGGRVLSPHWAAAHRAFHSTLISGCPSQRIRSIAASLRDSAELYRQWSWHVDDDRNMYDEHAQIADAVLGREPVMAMELTTQHLQATTTSLLAQLLEETSDESANLCVPETRSGLVRPHIGTR